MKNISTLNKFRKRFNKNILMIFTLIAMFIVTTIYFAIANAVVSDKLVAIGKKEDQLILSNRLLSSDLVKSSSLSDISEKTNSMGFLKPSNILYLNEQESVASLR